MTKIAPDHLGRQAFVYVRQSTPDQLLHNHESRRRQYALADRAHILRSGRTIARTALDKDRRDDVVAGIDVGQKLVEQIAAAGVVPQMMVRIDDRQIGFEDRLAQLGEPFGVGQRARIGAGFDWHCVPPEGGLIESAGHRQRL